MRHGVIAGIAAIVLALGIGALIASWDAASPPNNAGLPDNSAMSTGRSSADTAPAYGNTPEERKAVE